MSSLARFGRIARLCIRRNNAPRITTSVRHGSSHEEWIPYRDQPQIRSKANEARAFLLLYVTVCWMGYNMYHHLDEWFLGEFPTIDPSKFTDEELGIPPDEEDIYPPGYTPLKDRS